MRAVILSNFTVSRLPSLFITYIVLVMLVFLLVNGNIFWLFLSDDFYPVSQVKQAFLIQTKFFFRARLFSFLLSWFKFFVKATVPILFVCKLSTNKGRLTLNIISPFIKTKSWTFIFFRFFTKTFYSVFLRCIVF